MARRVTTGRVTDRSRRSPSAVAATGDASLVDRRVDARASRSPVDDVRARPRARSCSSASTTLGARCARARRRSLLAGRSARRRVARPHVGQRSAELRARAGAAAATRRRAAPSDRCSTLEPHGRRRPRDRRRHHRRAHVRGRRATGAPGAFAYREFPQHFPRPGWVEHDADEIWAAVARHARRGRRARSTPARPSPRSASPTSARPSSCGTARTGRPLHRAIVWQDRRTAARCDELRAAGHEPLVRARTGLVLDPYFSATKLEWLLARGRRRRRRRPRVRHRRLVARSGTSPAGRRRRARDRPVEREPHAALRHRRARRGPTSCCDLFGVPAVVPARGARRAAAASASRDPARAGGLAVPVSGIAGDQQAALFGQACFEPGHDEEHLRHRLVRAHEPRATRTRRRSTACSPPSRGRSATTVTYALEGVDLRHRRRGPVAARRARHHRRRGRDRPARRERRPTPAASCSCPRSPGSARRSGTRTPAARSSASPAARRARAPRPRGGRGDGVADRRRRRRDHRRAPASPSPSCASTAAPA